MNVVIVTWKNFLGVEQRKLLTVLSLSMLTLQTNNFRIIWKIKCT